MMVKVRLTQLLVAAFWTVTAIAAQQTKPEHGYHSHGDVHHEVYDYIIVGGGVAGMVLAEGISSNPDLKVLLLEAGPDGTDSALINTPGFAGQLVGSQYAWNYSTTPQTTLDGRSAALTQGHALGGGSAINYMGYCRSAKSTYDEWADISGDLGLRWESLYEDFKATTRYEPGVSPIYPAGYVNDSAYGDGPLIVSQQQAFDGFDPTWHQVLVDGLGVESRDLNAGYGIGAAYITAAIRPSNRTRDYALEAYGWQMAERRNAQILHGAWATKVGFDSNRANSVEYVIADSDRTYTARAREIIIAAGAIGSPKLLMLSGVGPASHLNELGINVIADIPDVGLNLRDHHLSAMEFEVDSSVSTVFQWASNTTRFAEVTAEYEQNATGPLANIAGGSFAVARVPDEVLEAANDTFHLATPKDRGHLFYNYATAPFVPPAPNVSVVSLYAALVQPKASGSVRLNSSDYKVPPLIDSNYYGSGDDMTAILYGYKQLRALAGSEMLAGIIQREVFPGPETKTDAELMHAIKTSAQTLQHPVGTVSLGTVLDSKFRVRGLDGIRVVDSSAIPYPPVCLLQANVYAIAHRVARAILEEERGIGGA